MKRNPCILYAFSLCLFAFTIKADDVGNANDYIDEVLGNLRREPKLLKKLDPLYIPDVNETNFEIKNGNITGLSSLYRHGDCTLAYDNEVVKVSVEVAVRNVIVHCKYRAKALFFWVKDKKKFHIFHRNFRHVKVAVEHLAVKMDISGKNGKAKLDSFKVVDLGEYKIKKITGMSVVLNWLLKLIANAVAKNSKKKIIDAMENGVASAVGELLEKYQLPKLGG